jgi:hypothetical protein
MKFRRIRVDSLRSWAPWWTWHYSMPNHSCPGRGPLGFKMGRCTCKESFIHFTYYFGYSLAMSYMYVDHMILSIFYHKPPSRLAWHPRWVPLSHRTQRHWALGIRRPLLHYAYTYALWPFTLDYTRIIIDSLYSDPMNIRRSKESITTRAWIFSLW